MVGRFLYKGRQLFHDKYNKLHTLSCHHFLQVPHCHLYGIYVALKSTPYNMTTVTEIFLDQAIFPKNSIN